jgi:hypothetical protein
MYIQNDKQQVTKNNRHNRLISYNLYIVNNVYEKNNEIKMNVDRNIFYIIVKEWNEVWIQLCSGTIVRKMGWRRIFGLLAGTEHETNQHITHTNDGFE